MPHRTTYFFPRQFPDRRFDSSFSSSNSLPSDHEKKITKVSSFNVDSDRKSTKEEVGTVGGKVSDGSVTGNNIRGKQLAAFFNWLGDKKGERKSSSHVRFTLDTDRFNEEEHPLLLPPEAVVPPATETVVDDRDKDHGFKRQVGIRLCTCLYIYWLNHLMLIVYVHVDLRGLQINFYFIFNRLIANHFYTSYLKMYLS